MDDTYDRSLYGITNILTNDNKNWNGTRDLSESNFPLKIITYSKNSSDEDFTTKDTYILGQKKDIESDNRKTHFQVRPYTTDIYDQNFFKLQLYWTKELIRKNYNEYNKLKLFNFESNRELISIPEDQFEIVHLFCLQHCLLRLGYEKPEGQEELALLKNCELEYTKNVTFLAKTQQGKQKYIWDGIDENPFPLKIIIRDNQQEQRKIINNKEEINSETISKLQPLVSFLHYKFQDNKLPYFSESEINSNDSDKLFNLLRICCLTYQFKKFPEWSFLLCLLDFRNSKNLLQPDYLPYPDKDLDMNFYLCQIFCLRYFLKIVKRDPTT